MNYRSVSDLNDDVRRLAEELSTDVDLIVGVPRSGLLAANLLCLHLDAPVTDVDGLCEGRILSAGRRFDGRTEFPTGEDETVLVIDDSVKTGRQMTETKRRIADQEFPFAVEYAAVYVSPTGYDHVDHWVDAVGWDRVFEWNLLHHPDLGQCCIDIDGVLCRDPTPDENDDGEAYREFLRTVEPKIQPTERIGWLVTCRLEKYREETERWLERHGIEYDELVMMDLPSKAVRKREGNHAGYKAEVYEETGAKLFIESDPAQSTVIARETGMPVYCYESREIVRPGQVASAYASAEGYLARLASNPISFSTKATKFLLSRSYHKLNRMSRGFRRQ